MTRGLTIIIGEDRQSLLARITNESLQHALRFPQIYHTYRAHYAQPRSAGDLREWQRERLALLLAEILDTVPAFRATGVRLGPSDDPFGVLALLPPTSKDRMVDNLADHCSDTIDPKRCVAVVTSGTTGVPLRIVHSEDHLVHGAAREIARTLASGLGFDRKVLLPFKMGGGPWLEYTMVNTGFSRIAEFGFADGWPRAEREAVARRCVEFRPDMVFSHPSRCVSLVELLSSAGVDKLDVPVVRTFGETLTDQVRQCLAAFFGGQVRNHYGMNEVNTIAFECQAGNLHVDSHRLWVEVLGPGGEPVPDGTPGELTVTNFFNAVMPFVRYRTGDVGALGVGGCPCGDPAKVMTLLAGRDHGVIRLPDGGSVDALRVVRAMEAFPVRQLQVVQHDLTALTVLVSPLPGREGIDSWRGRALDAVRGALPGRLAVEIEPVAAGGFHRVNGGVGSGVDGGVGGDKVKSFVSLLGDRGL